MCCPMAAPPGKPGCFTVHAPPPPPPPLLFRLLCRLLLLELKYLKKCASNTPRKVLQDRVGHAPAVHGAVGGDAGRQEVRRNEQHVVCMSRDSLPQHYHALRLHLAAAHCCTGTSSRCGVASTGRSCHTRLHAPHEPCDNRQPPAFINENPCIFAPHPPVYSPRLLSTTALPPPPPSSLL